MANLHPRRHGALAAFLVVPFLAGQLLVAPTARAAPGNPALPAATGRTDAPKPLSAAQLSRRLTREVYGYLPYWELDSTTDAYLRYDLLSTISLFSFRYGSDGGIVATSAADRLVGPLGQTIIGHAHAAGVRVELAFSFSGVPAVNNDFFADRAATTTAIAETLHLLARTGADGVNLDVERLSNASFPAYGAFIGRLRKAVVARNPAGRVTVATNGAGSGALMAATAIDNGADRAFLMGYSYRSSGSSPVGSNSPVVKSDGDWDITSSLAEYARRGVPLDRVILGLPYYGLTRPTIDASLHAQLRTGYPKGTRPCRWNPGYPNFFVRDQGAIPTDARTGYDAAEQSAWVASYDASVGTWCQTYFDNPRSLRAKYDLALSRGLGGVGMWALGYDRGQAGYWDAIASRFSIVRLAGSDRYETAAKISAATYRPGVPVAYVATGTGFSDALAAGPVAAATGGPVVLVRPSDIPDATAAELRRLRPGRIVVLGGTSAVTDGVAKALRGFATTGRVDRIGGADRYATAAALSASTFKPGVAVAFIGTGLDFPDAMSGSAAGGVDHGPVLLVRPDRIPPATATELRRLAPGSIVVLGGPAVISDAVLADLGGYSSSVVRVSGSDRYATAAKVSARTFEPGVAVAYVATGLDFPDALAGASAATVEDGPLLLVRGTHIPAAALAELRRLKPRRIVILGGSGVVSASIARELRDLLAGP